MTSPSEKVVQAAVAQPISRDGAFASRDPSKANWTVEPPTEDALWPQTKGTLPFSPAHDPERHAAAPHVDGLMRHVHGLIRRPSADALGPYRGQWVAVRGGAVALSGGSATELVRHLRSSQETADSLFFVPLDPKIDRHGMEQADRAVQDLEAAVKEYLDGQT